MLSIFCMLKKEKIYPDYVSKHYPNREKQVVLLMIPNGEGWHYLAAKKLSTLLRGIIPKHNGNFYCLNRIHSIVTEGKRKSQQKYGKINIFVML